MDEVEGLGGHGGRRGHVWQGGSRMCAKGRDIRNSLRNAVWGRGRNRGLESGERPGENESRGVTPSEVQGSKFKTSTERRDSRTQGTVGVTLHGEEGEVTRHSILALKVRTCRVTSGVLLMKTLDIPQRTSAWSSSTKSSSEETEMWLGRDTGLATAEQR